MIGRTGSSTFRLLGFGAAAGGVALGAGLAVGFKKAVGEAREAQKATAQTNAVIKSTRGVANVTAKELGNLANAISNKTGVDDEAVQSAGNLLLTFKGVRNESGKGNKIFTQSTKAIVDMTSAVNKGDVTSQGLKASTIQVGKALNDPIKGMTALSRVGVTFTQGQKDQIAALVESGNKLKAQKIILKELKSEFGGSAAANADPFDKLKVSMNNLFETVGKSLWPALSSAADGVAKFVGQMQSGKGAGGDFAQGLKDGFEGAKTGVVASIAGVKTAIDWLKGAFQTIKPVLAAVGAWFTGAFNTIKTALNLSGGDMAQYVQGLVNAFNIAKTALGALAVIWMKIFTGIILPVVKRVLPGIQQIVQGTFRAIGGYVKVLTGILTLDFGKAWEGVRQIFSGHLKVIGGIIRAATAPFRAAAAAAAKGIWEGIKSVGGLVGGAGKWVIGKARDAIAGYYKTMFHVGAWLMDKLKDGLIAGIKGLVGIGGKVVGAIRRGIGKINIPFGLSGGSGGPALGREAGRFGAVTALAQSFGDIVTSGYRPGDPGWHGKNRARDYAGGDMMGFAKAVAGKYGGRLLELIHTPLGYGIKNGKRVPLSFWGPAVNADHFDHVHVAMRRGGKAGPSQGGPSVVYGEGKKAEWWVSQEGDKKKNRGWASEAVSSLGGVAMFRGGGTNKVLTTALAVAQRMGASRKQILALVEAGLVESNMRNLNHGDRDSLGFLQQRPSQGWGSAKQVRNVAHATRSFVSRAMRANRKGMSAGELAQAVQRSAFPGRYDKRKAQAMQMIAGVGAKRAKRRGSALDRARARLERMDLGTDLRAVGGDDRAKLLADQEKALRDYKFAIKHGNRNERLQALLTYRQSQRALWDAGQALESPPGAGDAGSGGGDDAAQALIDAQNEAAEAARQQTEALNALRDEMKKQTDLAERTHGINVGEVNRMFMDWVSGQLGGRGAASLRTLSKGASYA